MDCQFVTPRVIRVADAACFGRIQGSGSPSCVLFSNFRALIPDASRRGTFGTLLTGLDSGQRYCMLWRVAPWSQASIFEMTAHHTGA